ncbi:SETMAR [Cordylochernes scorpioides]|uniref:SETMAR n=1 Tax=Cordylochernes scorpioides TaxID=51811 RepID=A0ABY6LC23_9ARAC|nr:SETMAR [Cordylochernes scorpioides]
MTSLETWTITEKLRIGLMDWMGSYEEIKRRTQDRESSLFTVTVAARGSRHRTTGQSLTCAASPARHVEEGLDFWAIKKLLRVIVVYGDHALAERTCQKWFARFKSGNFGLEDEDPERHQNLRARFDEDPTQTQKELAKTLGVTQQAIFHRLKEIGMIRKV